MSNSPPPNHDSSSKSPLEFDDWIAIVVAFTTIGTILAWSFTQMDRGSNLMSLPLNSTASTSSTTSTASTLTKTDNTLELPQAGITPLTELLETTITPESSTITQPKTKTKPKISPSIATPQPAPTDTSTSDTDKAPDDIPTPDVDSPSAINFSDVPENFWARPFIVALVKRGHFGGDRQGAFQPDKQMTRAEFAVEVQKAFDPSPSRDPLNYRDVASDLPNAEAIDWATKTGFLKGYPGQIFQPDQLITRSQVLVSLASGLGLNSPPDTNSTLKRYEDANKIPNYGIGPVAAATQAGLVVNYPKLELFNPEKGATRAEVASFLYQALARLGKVEKIPSEYIVQPD